MTIGDDAFFLQTARIETGTFFHIQRGQKRIATIWNAKHDAAVANEVLRVLNAYADLAAIDGSIREFVPTE